MPDPRHRSRRRALLSPSSTAMAVWFVAGEQAVAVECRSAYGLEMQPEMVPELIDRFGVRMGEPLFRWLGGRGLTDRHNRSATAQAQAHPQYLDAVAALLRWSEPHGDELEPLTSRARTTEGSPAPRPTGAARGSRRRARHPARAADHDVCSSCSRRRPRPAHPRMPAGVAEMADPEVIRFERRSPEPTLDPRHARAHELA